MDYSAVGQHTHLAALMEQLATPGTILLTAATGRLVGGLVRVTALGGVPVKGLTAPVEAFELVGVTARRGLHARLVEVLEALAPERMAEQVERLAHHALRGEVWDKAVTYCQQAGVRAFDRAAFLTSVSCTSPKGIWSTPSGCWSRAWPSVVPPATGTCCE